MREVHNAVHHIAGNSAIAVMGMAAAVNAGAQELHHHRDLMAAQRLVNGVAAREAAANADFYDVLDQLHEARREVALMKAALNESDAENLRLSVEVGQLRRRRA